MLLGIFYNIFDGCELLEASIKSVRNVADIIVGVYQTTSNTGYKIDVDLNQLMNELKEKKLIDHIVFYEPNLSGGPQFNEVVKRNRGLDECRRLGCTHFMAMDVDEFFIEQQLMFVKETVIKEDLDSTACKLLSYYKTSGYRRDPVEEYYTALIIKLTQEAKMGRGHFPAYIDPTRSPNVSGKFREFTRQEIQMHHMSYVRKNLMDKLNSISSPTNMKQTVVDAYNNWKPGSVAYWHTYPVTIIETEDFFNISF